MSRQSNVFVLSVDSLPYTAFVDTSDQIARLIDGVNFTQAVAPASYTSSSMPAIATGSPTDQIPAWGLPESGGPTPLAERLAEQGYDCALWTDNYLFGSAYNYDRGFSAGNLGQPGLKKRAANIVRETPLSRLFWLFETTYFKLIEPLMSASTGESSFYRHASALNDQAIDWLTNRQSDAPAFCWLHYMDTHHPYQPPSSYLNEQSFSEGRSRSELGEFTREAIKSNGSGLSTDEKQDLKAAFEACSAYIADELERFVKQLREQGHYHPDVDVLVVTADHGEVLDKSKYGMLGHVPPAFWEEIIRVPLIIGHPDWDADTVDEQVSLLDLKQIVLDSVGLTDKKLVPRDVARSVTPVIAEWEELDDGSVTTYRGVRRDDGRKLFGAKRDGNDRFLTTKVSPDRSDTILADVCPDADNKDLPNCGVELRRELTLHGDAVEVNSNPAEATTGADEEHLRALGYID